MVREYDEVYSFFRKMLVVVVGGPLQAKGSVQTRWTITTVGRRVVARRTRKLGDFLKCKSDCLAVGSYEVPKFQASKEFPNYKNKTVFGSLSLMG